MPRLYVNKLTSLNPNRYAFLPVDLAIERYGQYCRNVEGSYHSPKLTPPERNKLIKAKSFDKWLRTEI